MIGKWIAEFVSGLGLGDVIGEWQRRVTLRAENKAAIEMARARAEISRWEALAKAEADWDTEALRQTQYSWKDEWFVVLLSAPFLGSFLPVVQDYVLVGWEYVALAPGWYQWSFIGAVTASFGLRWMSKSGASPFARLLSQNGKE